MRSPSPIDCPQPCAANEPAFVFYLTLISGGRDVAYWTDDDDLVEPVLSRLLVVKKTSEEAPTEVLSADALGLTDAEYSKLPYWVLDMEQPPTFCRRWGYTDINPLWGHCPPPSNLDDLVNNPYSY